MFKHDGSTCFARVLFIAIALLLLLGIAGGATFATSPESTDTNPVITVDLNATNGKIERSAFGLTMANEGQNAAELMYYFRSTAGQQRLNGLGARVLNFGADRDNWAQPYSPFTAVPLYYPEVMLTDEFLQLNKTIDSEPIITVNITNQCWQHDTGLPPSSNNVDCKMATPQQAKNWLNYIKAVNIRPVKYVQLGAEPYAGCSYWKDAGGVNCVTSKGEHKIQLTQQEYAERVLQWAKALRQIDPTIKLGLHLLPNNYVCKEDCGGVSWDEYLLKKVGNKIDFVITHQYFEIDQPVSTDAAAERFSYYQEQTDVRVDKQGVTAMPVQIRKELIKWLPKKKNIPIVVGEFNAARTPPDDDALAINTRMSLFAGFSIAEGYLDSIAPVKIKDVSYSGASRVILLDMHTLPVMISHFLPLDNPTTLVHAPAWHMLSALQEFQGKTWIGVNVKRNPNTAVGRPALRVYAVKKGKDVWLAVFNHSTTNAQTADVKIIGAVPVSARATVIGDTAASFLSMNTASVPDLIAPVTTDITAGQVKKDRLAAITFPAHSLTVIRFDGK